ncbi:tetratricopeptide repeat protein [Pseudomonas sp. RA_35y_Pfl2_P32]|uniref:tetratricopeptide repeat protein n=1 Tax=Pseudomonas sp. RA_35y_Pfl2_P32 TaxID=3088705 RepID=UPI0030D7EE25
MTFVQEEINAEFFARVQAGGEEEALLGDFCKVLIRGKHLPTVIAFSSVNTIPGRFKPYKAITKSESNIVFVNDCGNNWYLKGIEGFDEDFIEAAKKIVEVARQVGNGFVMTFGTSMGAYGAMLYAAVGGADKCIAFGPEVILDLPGSRSAQHKNRKAKLSFSDLSYYIENSDCTYDVVVSESDEVDLINAISMFSLNNVKVSTVRGAEHPGVQAFDYELGIGNVIDASIGGADLVAPQGRGGAVLENSELVKDLWISLNLKREKNYLACLDYLISLAYKHGESSLYVLRLGEAYYRNGMLEKAVECLKVSVELDGFQYEAHNLLGVVLRRLERHEEAEHYLKEAIRITPMNPFPYHNLGLTYMEVGLLDLALESCEKAVSLNKGNPNFIKTVNEIMEMR